jgi:hypothetical protein
MQIIVCLQLLKYKLAQIEILSVYAWANLVRLLKYPLLSSIKPSYNQMMVLFLAVYDDAAT